MSTKQNTFICNDYENSICVTTGSNHFDVPSVPSVPSLETGMYNFSKTDNTFRDEYFDNILKDDIRIKMINGVPTNFDYDALFCDYCSSQIGSMNKDDEISNGYWRCWDCQKDMCNLCHSEINETIALQNGAQNYHLRKDKIQSCLGVSNNSPHKLQKRDNTSLTNRGCDLCNSEINVTDKFRWSEDASNYDSKDICQKCSNTPNGMHHILLWKMQEVDMDKTIKSIWNNCEFGSLMDWIPIYKDEEFNMILMNCNPESTEYGKVCLSACDDHGRTGYFTIPHNIDLNTLLEGMILEYNDACSKLKENGEEDRIKYLSPIQVLMESFNMPTYYG